MRLAGFLVGSRVRLERFPLSLLIDASDRFAQSAIQSARLSKLLRQFSEQTLTRQITARLRDLMMQHLRKTEMLKQRHDVRERFVKREHVRISRIQISRQHGVE